MSLNELDAEIREVQARIAAEKLALHDAVTGCTNSLRDTVASPKTLIALLGIGYGLGKVMFNSKKSSAPVAAPAAKGGLLGLLTGVAGTALSLAQPRFGVGSIARWAAQRAFAPRSTPTARPSRGTPAVTTPTSVSPSIAAASAPPLPRTGARLR
jgi:hypothetical protein